MLRRHGNHHLPDLYTEMGFAKRLGKKAVGLEECRASFEASLREAPQDEAFFLMPSTIYPHAEERRGAAGARLEARSAPIQRILTQSLRFHRPHQPRAGDGLAANEP